MSASTSTSPLRLDGYVRISQVGKRHGERFISPKVQREEIQAWAERRGDVLLTVFEELDESGGRADRALLEKAIGRIEGGISQGLVVCTTDRFGRSLINGLLAIQRIQQADGQCFAVREGLDISTDAGRLVVRIMLSMAEWDAERRRANWEVARSQAISRGVYVGALTPVGYRRSRSGRLRIDPQTAPVIAELFRRRVAGETLSSLDRLLEEHAIPSPRGYPGWVGGARQLIKKREYLGEVRCAGYVNDHAHPPLVDMATWQAAQRPVLGRPTRRRVDALLGGGLARCAGCGMTLSPATGSRAWGERYLYYQSMHHYPAGTCDAPAGASARLLNPCVEDIVFGILRRRRRAPVVALRTAAERLEQAQDGLAAYRDSDQILRAIGERRFAAGLATRAQGIRELSLQLESLRAKHAIYELPPTSELEAQWPQMTTAERRTVITKVIDCVFVKRGRGNIDQRVTGCPVGTAPSGMFRTAHNKRPLRCYQTRRAWITADGEFGHAPQWSDERLRRELATFIAGRDEWPSPKEFWLAGRGRLHRQVITHGGDVLWSCRLGLPSRTGGPWTEDRVRATLAHYLRGKTMFPIGPTFAADGQLTLWHWVGRTGGCRRWAAEFNLPHAKRKDAGTRKRWTIERIAAELHVLCQGRTTFPSTQELSGKGPPGLVYAIYRYGGANWWAQQFGLPRIKPQGDAKREHPIPGRLFPIADLGRPGANAP